jgi:hypothetical protein
VFEIVQGLLEIQHLTEKSLYNQRLRLQNEHRGARGRRDGARVSSGSARPENARSVCWWGPSLGVRLKRSLRWARSRGTEPSMV